ncbi:MAG: hypothetical protein NZ700_14865, partial [Gemmataceae bacterium]|nr:hypothetical protein [Gemmataceae bacterium]MDW8263958.1 hypothetical protein [Gemmataceae bacterium]
RAWPVAPRVTSAGPGAGPPLGARPGRLRRDLAAFLGWTWRLLAGAFLCFNAPVLSWLTSIAVAGWLYRWMQALVLRGWWRRGPRRPGGSFDEFCRSLGPDAPVSRPRWFWRERGHGFWFRSLWLNFSLGLQAIACTFLVTGWGVAVMYFSWEFGWLNSFHKGYEQATVGATLGWFGIFLFLLALVYVPMAQAHQAATGDFRAFFDVPFVIRLIHARMTAYVALAGLIALLAWPLELFKIAVVFAENIDPSLADASPAEAQDWLQRHFRRAAFVLFVSLLLSRGLAAVIYRSAVLKALRRGWVQPEALHPTLARWLDDLDLWPRPEPGRGGFFGHLRRLGRWTYRGTLYLALLLIWFVFTARIYVGQFFVYHPVVGFLNQPLIQVPCFDYTPSYPDEGQAEGLNAVAPTTAAR